MSPRSIAGVLAVALVVAAPLQAEAMDGGAASNPASVGASPVTLAQHRAHGARHGVHRGYGPHGRPPAATGVRPPPAAGWRHPSGVPHSAAWRPPPRPPGWRPVYPPPGGWGWARPPGYWWGGGGALVAGAAIGMLSAAAVAAWAPPPPAPGLCWYYTDPSQRTGFWDNCP